MRDDQTQKSRIQFVKTAAESRVYDLVEPRACFVLVQKHFLNVALAEVPACA